MPSRSLLPAKPNAAAKNGKKHRTKESLLNAALSLIAQKGVDNTSVLEITQSLEISNGAFYYHFQNIDELLEELGYRVTEQLIKQIWAVTRIDPAAQVARGPLIILTFIAENPDLREVLLRVTLAQESRNVELGSKLRDEIERGQRIGRFSIESVDLAVRICSSISLSALSGEEIPGLDLERLMTLTAVHSLAVLGVPFWEAHEVVARELFALNCEREAKA